MEQIKKVFNEVVESLAMNETDETEAAKEWNESIDEGIAEQVDHLEPIADVSM